MLCLELVFILVFSLWFWGVGGVFLSFVVLGAFFGEGNSLFALFWF